VLGLAAQGAKIAVDTIVQRDTADAFRGRAFALYDVLFNAAFVGAAALAAVALPDTGWSPAVFALIAAGYLATALAYRTRATEPAEVPAPA
jgi:fatty acid desaturase